MTVPVSDAAPLPTKKKQQAPQAQPSQNPSATADPLLPPPPLNLPTLPDPTKSPKNPLGDTVEGVTRGLTGTLGLNQSQPTDGTTTEASWSRK